MAILNCGGAIDNAILAIRGIYYGHGNKTSQYAAADERSIARKYMVETILCFKSLFYVFDCIHVHRALDQ